ALLSALIIAAAFIVSDGFFIIDEVVYYMGAEALWSGGSLTVENGFADFGSKDLKLLLLSKGPGGLTPQYPIGLTALGAPLVGALGPRGLIVLNALAAAATLFAARELAWRMFGDARVALAAPLLLAFASFWPEYAFGMWPHSLALCGVTLAFALALAALQRPERAAGLAFASGMAAGCAFLFRIDAMLALPAIAALAILRAPRPVAMLAAGAAGLAPALVAAALVNGAKFGTFNPLSYGSDTGSLSLAKHLPALMAAALGLGLLAALRHLDRRQGRLLLLALGAALLAGAALVPQLGGGLVRVAHGARALLIDATVITDSRSGVVPMADGTLLFWGIAKKALGQSLPWLGLLAALPFLPGRDGRRDAYLLCLIAVVAGLAPFLPGAWHGGLGANMRYLLPLLPLLAALFARIWLDLAMRGGAARQCAVIGAVIGVGAVWMHLKYGAGGMAGAGQLMATWMLGGVALAGVAAGALRGTAAAQTGMIAGAAGVAAASLFGIHDLAVSQARRIAISAADQALSQIQPPSLLHGTPESFAFQIGRPDGLMAIGNATTGQPDDALLRQAAARGYAVWIGASAAARFIARNPGYAIAGRIETPLGPMVELAPAG
ncbi:MAG: hypothetical protein ACJA1L_001121, partial [Paracoccaceae bacterium]